MDAAKHLSYRSFDLLIYNIHLNKKDLLENVGLKTKYFLKEKIMAKRATKKTAKAKKKTVKPRMRKLTKTQKKKVRRGGTGGATGS